MYVCMYVCRCVSFSVIHAHTNTVHVHHETTQCFVKQSRDFCILANERTEVRLSACIYTCTLAGFLLGGGGGGEMPPLGI